MQHPHLHTFPLLAMDEEKICSNGPGHMTRVAVMPKYGIDLKNILLQNQCANGLETWYVASGH